jgi:hypothetical protein
MKSQLQDQVQYRPDEPDQAQYQQPRGAADRAFSGLGTVGRVWSYVILVIGIVFAVLIVASPTDILVETNTTEGEVKSDGRVEYVVNGVHYTLTPHANDLPAIATQTATVYYDIHNPKISGLTRSDVAHSEPPLSLGTRVMIAGVVILVTFGIFKLIQGNKTVAMLAGGRLIF